MSRSDKPWFSCCNTEDIRHDKWQDIDPRAKTAAQREIDIITGKTSSQTQSSNSHTQNFSIETFVRPHSNTKHINNKIKTTKNVVDSMEESIIYGRFDDLITSNSFVKAPLVGQQQQLGGRVNGVVEQHRVVGLPGNSIMPVYHNYVPQVQHQVYQQMPVNNIYVRR